MRRLTDAAFAQIDAHAAPAAEAGSVATVGGLVAAGLGVSAMPALVLPLLGAGPVVCRPLAGPVVDRRLDIVLRARRTAPARGAGAFLETLRGVPGTAARPPARRRLLGLSRIRGGHQWLMQKRID